MLYPKGTRRATEGKPFKPFVNLRDTSWLKSFREGALLTTIEKIIFILLALTSAGFTIHGIKTIIDSVRKGRPAPALKNLPVSLIQAAITVLFQQTIFKARKLLSAIHMGLFFGLITYAFVNLVDVLEGFIPALS